MSRKRNHRMRPVQADARHWAGALLSTQPHSPEAVAQVMNITQAALVRILEGNGSAQDLTRLGRDLNVAWARSEQIENAEAAQQVIDAAADALQESARILRTHGRVGLTGPGRLALIEGVEMFRTIVAASSPRQMSQAEDAVMATERAVRARMERRTSMG